MRILWLATKAPWPPIDGGRLLLYDTLRGLRDRGHEITLVAPVDPGAFDRREVEDQLTPLCTPALISLASRSWFSSALQAQLTAQPLTVARHWRREVRSKVRDLLTSRRFDIIQLEQIQAWGSLPVDPEDLARRGLPVVLRAQNVESDLWRATAAHHVWSRPVFRLEARRLAAFEGWLASRVSRSLALTREDAARLEDLAQESLAPSEKSLAPGRVEVVRAPFAAELPPADDALPGDPAVVLLGSSGWLPNREGANWFARGVWPRVLASAPGARLHSFGLRLGADLPGVIEHPPPSDSRDAMPATAILAVPLRIASGVRIKILEAWARGLPVVATSIAARGLETTAGEELLVADDGEAFAQAILSLAEKPDLRQKLVTAGRAKLLAEHDLKTITRKLEAIYTTLLD